jgi:hypothetical protein
MRRLIFGPGHDERERLVAETERADLETAAIVRRLQEANARNARALGMSVGEALADAFARGEREGERRER